MQSDKLSKIFDVYPDINLVWLVTGKGAMIMNFPDGQPTPEMLDRIVTTVSIGYEKQLDDLEAKYAELLKKYQVLVNQKAIDGENAIMIVGTNGEGAEIAISVLKDELSETRAKLIRCLEEKEKFVTGYGNINLNEPAGQKK